jgi:hypothetical protein
VAAEPSRGPEVPPQEELLRAIVRPEWWNGEENRVSSGILSHNKTSAFIDALAPAGHPIRGLPKGSGQLPDGAGVLKFNCGTARQYDFDARHEPENGDNAHANVYCDLNSNQRKKRIRKLLDASTTSVTTEPIMERLRASAV